MRQITFEVCAGSYKDCLAAEKGGADRVELNSALSVGGLTPSLGSLIRAKRETKFPIICMVRPRAGGFCYDENEVQLMLEEAELLLKYGADGIAFGFLKVDGNVDAEKTKTMVDLIHRTGGEAVFHRAFDVTPDPVQAIETLIDCGVDRLLTSGQQAKASEGAVLLKELQNRYGGKIELMAGSGVNAGNVRELIEKTGIRQVHSSCKTYRTDPTTETGNVSYAYLKEPHRMDYDCVDVEQVRALVAKEEGYFLSEGQEGVNENN